MVDAPADAPASPAAAARPGPRSRHAPLPVVPIVLAAGVLVRVWKLGQKNLFLDEAVSWFAAKQPLAGLVGLAAADIHPPLYYLVLKGWIAVAGESVRAMRGLSVAFGVLVLLLAYRLARRWLDPAASVAVLVWLALSPELVASAQDVRMYTAVAACVLAASLFYRRWIASAFERTGALVGVGVAVTVGLYLHYFTALLVAALWAHLVVLTAGRTRFDDAPPAEAFPAGWRRWVVANLGVAVAYAPWLPTAVAQLTRGQSWRRPVTVFELPSAIPVLWQDLLAGGPHEVASPALSVAGSVVSVVVAAGSLGLTWKVVRRRRSEADAFLLIVGWLPIAVALALLPVSGGIRLSRYVGYVTPFLVIGAARGLSRHRAGRSLVVGTLLAAAVASWVCLEAYFGEHSKDTDVRPIVAHLERALSAKRREGGGTATVVVEPAYMNLPFAYYAPALALPTLSPSPDDGVTSHLVDRVLASSADGPVWLVIENKWERFGTLDPSADSRLAEVRVPGNRRHDIRLFRVAR